MNPAEPLPISDELHLKIFRIVVEAQINETQLAFAMRRSDLVDGYVLRCTRKVAYLPASPELKLWATWWDAFKCRWFPQWALHRWPPTFRTFEARAYFQNLPIPPRGDHIVLYTWAARPQTEAPK